MDRTNWIRYILTATDRASRQVLASDSAIRKSIKDTQNAATSSASRQSAAFSRVASDAETSSRRVVRSLDNQARSSKAAREELRKFGFEQTRAWRAGAGFDNHLRNTNLHLTRLRQSIRNLAVPALVAAFTTMAQAASTAAGGAVALVGALEPLGGLVSTLPGGVIGLAQAFGTLFGAISPVSQAIGDYMNMWKTAATQEQGAEKRIFSAAKAIKAAQQGVRDATLQTAEANRTLKDSQGEVERAQVELNKAVSDGKREMIDLKNAAIDAALGQRQAGLSLRQAISDLQRTELDPHSTMLEVEQARLAVDQAKQGAREATIAAQRARSETERAQTGGVQKMPNVIAAQRALNDAKRAEADAARSVVKAETAVSRALEKVTDAHKQGAMAAGTQASQLVNLRYSLSQLSPAGKQFALFMAKFIQGPIGNLAKASQTAFLPKLEKGILKAAGVFPVLSRTVTRTGNVLGGLSIEAGRLIGSKGFGRQLDQVTESNSKVMRTLGRAALSVAKGMMIVAVAARPLTEWLSRLVKGWADTWLATQRTRRETGALGQKFEETKDIVRRLVSIVSNLYGALNNILHLSKPLGDSMFAAFDRSSRRFEEWTESAKGKTQIERFFDRIKPALFEAGRLFADMAQGLARMGMTAGLASLIRQMRLELLPAILEVSEGFSSAFGPGLVELLTSTLHLFNALGHPLTVMLDVTAGIVDAFAGVVEHVPGMKQLLGVIIGISLASRAISFVSAISGVSALVGKMRDLRAAAATPTMGGKAAGIANVVAQSTAEPGITPARPLYVFVVNEMMGGVAPVMGGGKGKTKINPNQMTLPLGTAATTVADDAAAATTGAARGGLFSRAGGAVKGALRSPKVAVGAGIAGTAAVIGGSMIPGKLPGMDVGIGEAVGNIGGGALAGAMFGPWGAAAGAAIGAIITFREQIADFVDFMKKHAVLAAVALSPFLGGLPLIVLGVVKWRKQIVGAFGAAFDWIVNAGDDVVDFFKRLPGRVFDGIKAMPDLIWDTLKSTPRMLGQFVGFYLTLPFRIGAVFVKLVGKIKDIVVDLGPKLLNWGARAMSFLLRAYVAGVKAYIGFWRKLPGRVLDMVQKLPGTLFRFGGKVMDKLLDGLRGGGPGVLHFVSRLPGRIIDAIGKLASKIYDAGKFFAKEFAKGIYDALPGPVRDALDWGAGAVGDAAGAIFGGGGSDGPSNPERSRRETERRFANPESFLPPQLRRGRGKGGTGPDPDDDSHRKTRKNWKDTTDRISKNADTIRKKVKTDTDNVRSSLQGNFDKAGDSVKRNTDRMRQDTRSTMSEVASVGATKSNAFSLSMKTSMSSASGAVHDGLSYILDQTNKSLKGLDAPPLKVRLDTPKGGGKGKGGGGQGQPAKAASGAMWNVGGAGLQDTVPVTHGDIAAMVAPGETMMVANRHQKPLLDMAVANTFPGVGGMDDFFGSFSTPHFMARGTPDLTAAIRRYAGGGMVDVPSDPDHASDPNDQVAAAIMPEVNAWVKRYRANITAAFDPGGGHVSPGHNVTGTATDVVPAGGWTPPTTSLFEAGLGYLVSKGFEVLYDGHAGTISYPNHGRYNHAHIEWVGNGTRAGARIPGVAGMPGLGGFGAPKMKSPQVKGRGFTQNVAQAAMKVTTGAANKYLGKKSSIGIGGVAGINLTGVSGSVAQQAAMIAKRANSPYRSTLALFEALWAESSMGSASPGNVLQALPPYTQIRPAAQEISGFLTGNPTWTGTAAIPLARSGSLPAHAIAQLVQKSGVGEGNEGRANYLKAKPLALGTMKKFGFARGGTVGTAAARNRTGKVKSSLEVLRSRGLRPSAMSPIPALTKTTGSFALGGTVSAPTRSTGSFSVTPLLARSSDDAAKSVGKLAGAVAVLGVASAHAVGQVGIKPDTFKPNLELKYLPASAPFSQANTAAARSTNRQFGTASNAFPFTQFGFEPTELFDWEKFKKDAHWKTAEKATKEALKSLGKVPTDKFKKWIPILEAMNFKELGRVLGQLKALIEEQAETVKKLVDAVKEKTKELIEKATGSKSPGGKKITHAERKAIEKAQKEAQPGIEAARGKLKQTRGKSRVAAAIRKPLVRFHNAIQNLSVGQLNQQQQQIEQQIAQVKKGGVSKKERGKLQRLQTMLEDVTTTISDHIKRVLEAAEMAVEKASFAHNMADLGLQHLELEQQLSGTNETIAGKEARAGYIRGNIIPALQAEQSALESQLAAARELGGPEGEKLAMQIAEQIAGVQNGILEAQLEAQELTAAEVKDLNDAISGSLGFEFNSQGFTDLIGLGVGT